MPRDNDKNNGRPPRRDRGAAGSGGKGRSGGSGSRGGPREDRGARSADLRGGDRKFGDRKFGDKKPYTTRRSDKPFAAKGEGFRKDSRRGDDARGGRPSPRFDRDERPARDDRAPRGPRKEFGSRDGGGRNSEGRPAFKPRDDRGSRPFAPRNRDDRPQRNERGDARPGRSAGAERFSEKKFGEKRSYTPRGDRGDAPRPSRFNRDDRTQHDERPARRGAPDRGSRKDFNRGEDRSADKPWQKRGPSRDDGARSGRPTRDGARRFDKPRDNHDRPKFDRPRSDRPRDDRAPRGATRSEWQEHPRSEWRADRPRRDNEDDSKIFAKRAAFGGRGAYRERKPEFDKRAARDAAPVRKKSGERIAKIVARAGLCSRRDAEEWITQGRVAVNGRTINSPALDISANDTVTIDGKPLPERERTRLFLFHKPRGLMTTHSDPEGRPTVFDNLPEGLPRLISVGRLDFNTEGLLLLTNDGGLARALELPDTGWLRRYRVRAHGEVTQAQLDALKKGVEVDGVKYGPIDATLERDKAANVWIVFAIREGKNREVRNVMAHLGLEVNRLIRISYGPFQLGEIAEGEVEEIKTRVLREQLGDKIVAMSGALFDRPVQDRNDDEAVSGHRIEAHSAKSRNKSAGKNALIADRKGRRILVTRSGSDEARARNEEGARGLGPPRRPTRGYKGKRDLTPKDR